MKLARLVGRAESSITLYLRDTRHSGVRKIRRRPCYACIFLPCSDDCHCEKFVTELSARPTSVVLGVLSPDTVESAYVMFELGAAWAQRIYTCPLLSKGAEFSHIPGPIFDLAPARLWETNDCHQLLENLQVELDLEWKSEGRGAVSDEITALSDAAKP